ncbi:MAG: DUF3592 domain-containing protein, partial [Streptosporangiales bacterium]|nr:DUF3592 domain-containing protein [Streptosporangiales bacterium]
MDFAEFGGRVSLSFAPAGGDGMDDFGLLVGVIMIGVGVLVLLRARGLRRTGVRVPGQVVAIETTVSVGDSRRRTYHPIYTFTTPEGRELRIRSSTGRNAPYPRPGMTITVIYEPDAPQ